MSSCAEKRVVEGCKLPSVSPITDDELAWIEFLRIVYDDAVPAPNFDQIVQLQQMDRRNPMQRAQPTARPTLCAGCMATEQRRAEEP
jgi:hypothetical protein